MRHEFLLPVSPGEVVTLKGHVCGRSYGASIIVSAKSTAPATTSEPTPTPTPTSTPTTVTAKLTDDFAEVKGDFPALFSDNDDSTYVRGGLDAPNRDYEAKFTMNVQETDTLKFNAKVNCLSGHCGGKTKCGFLFFAKNHETGEYDQFSGAPWEPPGIHEYVLTLEDASKYIRNGEVDFFFSFHCNMDGYVMEFKQIGGVPSSTTPTPTPPPVSLADAEDNTELTWTTGGDADWFGQPMSYYYDGDAARSGAISDKQNTWLQTTVSGPGTLSFYWKVSTESGYDYLKCYLDGSEQDAISGSTSWAKETYSIDPGTHTLRWSYEKDGSGSSGADCGWLDCVQFHAGPIADFSFSVHGLKVDFTDLSYDPDGGITSWNWDFGDGKISNNMKPSHIYQLDENYPVTLTVTDNDGYKSSVTKHIQVGNIITKVSYPKDVASGITLNVRVETDVTEDITLSLDEFSETKRGKWVSFFVPTSDFEPGDHILTVLAGEETYSDSVFIYDPLVYQAIAGGIDALEAVPQLPNIQ